jgi:hypothetical protein
MERGPDTRHLLLRAAGLVPAVKPATPSQICHGGDKLRRSLFSETF